MNLRTLISSLSLCLVATANLLNAQNVVVSAKLEARNPNGTPIPVKYVYPVAELASGETGKLHIGELYRFEGVSVVERELGLVLNLTVETEGENVRYYGEAKSTQLADVSETGCSFKATEAYIEGEVLSGESVALWLKGPSDDFEAITLHFAIKDAEPTTDAEPAAN